VRVCEEAKQVVCLLFDSLFLEETRAAGDIVTGWARLPGRANIVGGVATHLLGDTCTVCTTNSEKLFSTVARPLLDWEYRRVDATSTILALCLEQGLLLAF
jgi:hypothetical protein